MADKRKPGVRRPAKSGKSSSKSTGKTAVKSRTRRSQPRAKSRGHVDPYLLYSALTFVPGIGLTLLVKATLLPEWPGLFVWLIVHNVVTFLVYGYDKRIAGSGVTRVPEGILLLQVLAGAVVGAPLARSVFRHKTQKSSFRIRFWACEALGLVGVVLWSYRILSGHWL